MARKWIPYGVLFVAIAIWSLATLWFDYEVKERDRVRFQGDVRTTVDRVESRVDTYVAVLLATRGFVLASGDAVNADSFRHYVGHLDLQSRYPGIQGIGFTLRIPPGEREAVEERIARERGAPFRVWPEGPRDEMHTIVYLEPLDRRNQAAIGFDMYSQPVRRAAMSRARDSGAPAASGRVTLVQEIDPSKQAGFLIYVPIYAPDDPGLVEQRRAALRGFVYSPFRAGDLLEGIFGTETSPGVAFEVFDGVEATPEAIMARVGGGSGAPREGQLVTSTRLHLAGRTWTLVFRTTPAFEALSSRRFVPLFGIVGLLASAALFVVTRAQVRARDEAEVQRNNLRDLFTQAPAAIAILRGGDFRYELSNPVNQEFAGGRALVGKTATEAFPELAAQGILALLEKVYRTGEPVVMREVPITQAPGGEPRQIYVSGTYQPFRGAGGKVEGVMVFAYEVTDLVTSRQKVEALAEDLRKAVRVRDDFLSIAGHELKTPLATLKLQVQGLQRQIERGTFGTATAALRERLERAARQVDRLERLVGDLLDVSRITSGRMALHTEDVDLAALVSDVAERFGPELERAGCTLRIDRNGRAVGRWDRARLDQVFTNLVSNAIKYGSGKPIVVSVRGDEGRARATVADQGIGIDAADRERIFGRFERAVSERHYGGFGLGLWIVHQIVEAHGGNISLESEPGRGSAFTVELPLRTPAEGEENP